MHILFALSGFYPNHNAGTETYVLNLSKELINWGYKVSVIIPSIGDKMEVYNYKGINVYSFFVPKKISTKELNGLEKPSGIEEFKGLLLEIKPDIFHLHSLSRSLHAEHLKIASALSIKTVFTAHLGSTFCVKGDLLLFGSKQCDGKVNKQRCLACFIMEKTGAPRFFSSTSSFFINQVIFKSPASSKFPAFNIVTHKEHQLKLLKKYNQATIAIADWIKQSFAINGFSNIRVIKQGTDKHFLTANGLTKNRDKINLVFIGRMHPDKGVHLLVEALGALGNSSFELIVITIPFKDEMGYYQSIKEQYKNLGYENWYENLTKEEVAAKLNNSDILILPSTKNEAAPLVILEAFAKKIPVIGSEYVAIKEMIQHNVNGLLFKSGDVQSLKKQLLRLINEPELIQRLSGNIANVRTFEDVAKEHDFLYKKLLNA